MLPILRVIFGVALLYEMVEGAKSAPDATGTGDLTGAAYLVVCVILGLLNAFVWAPYLGAKVSGPLTGVITDSTYVERTNWVLRFLRKCDARRLRRTTLALSFWEAVRHPDSPAPFVIGFKNARMGSWLERVFAREVFRFNHTQHCVEAYLALKRHGIDPRPHTNQDVNIMLLSLERPPRPEATTVALPSAIKPTPLPRNPRIRLFRQADQLANVQATPEAGSGNRAAKPDLEARPEREPEAQSDLRSEPESVGGWASGLLARLANFIRAH